MKKYIKVEIGIVVVSVILSLLAFWIEPGISYISKSADTTVTTVGWPFAVSKTTSGLDVSYVGTYTSHSSSGLVYDWLTVLVGAFVVINVGWWLIDSFKSKPEEKSADAE